MKVHWTQFLLHGAITIRNSQRCNFFYILIASARTIYSLQLYDSWKTYIFTFYWTVIKVIGTYDIIIVIQTRNFNLNEKMSRTSIFFKKRCFVIKTKFKTIMFSSPSYTIFAPFEYAVKWTWKFKELSLSTLHPNSSPDFPAASYGITKQDFAQKIIAKNDHNKNITVCKRLIFINPLTCTGLNSNNEQIMGIRSAPVTDAENCSWWKYHTGVMIAGKRHMFLLYSSETDLPGFVNILSSFLLFLIFFLLFLTPLLRLTGKFPFTRFRKLQFLLGALSDWPASRDSDKNWSAVSDNQVC